MRTLILYSSKYGFTENVAGILADHMAGDVVLQQCFKGYSVDLTQFDNVIIGSSIYVGKPNGAVLDFCENYQRLLMSKRIGFFVTGNVEEDALKVIRENYPENLVDKSKKMGYFGYEFNFEKMRFFDRFFTKLIVRKSESEYRILSNEIESFAQKFNV